MKKKMMKMKMKLILRMMKMMKMRRILKTRKMMKKKATMMKKKMVPILMMRFLNLKEKTRKKP